METGTIEAAELLIVPSLVDVSKLEPFESYGFVVLDKLLDCGIVGTVMRRLRVVAAVDPQMRVKYNELRAAYLSLVVPRIVGTQRGVVVVGSQPTDVDLLKYDKVTLINLTGLAMRDLSVVEYGEPVLLSTEYALVQSLVSDSVDSELCLSTWESLSLMLARWYVPSAVGSMRLSDGVEASSMRLAISSVGLPLSIMEPELDLLSPESALRVSVDFDYMAVVRPQWRDAVVGVLGTTPGLDDAFRLPWYVVDIDKIRALCYRTNTYGRPAVSMRGESLVDLVTNRMASMFTPGELAGTWIGALLCDSTTVAQAVTVLKGRSVVNKVVEPFEIGPKVRTTKYSGVPYVIPEELAWLYVASPGIVVAPSISDVEALEEKAAGCRPPSYSVAVALSTEQAPFKRDAIIAFMRRLHMMGEVGAEYAGTIRTVLEHLTSDNISEVDFSGVVTVLPGLTYLSLLRPAVRAEAYSKLGSYPTLSQCHQYMQQHSVADVSAVYSELLKIVERSVVMVGSLGVDLKDIPVGSTGLNLFGDGYCYLLMFRAEYHQMLTSELGRYPTIRAISSVPVAWRIPDWEKIVVSFMYDAWYGSVVMHLSRDVEVPRLGNLMAVLPNGFTDQVRVGALVGPQNKWFVVALVMITIASVETIALIVWMIYKCRGQSRGGSGSGYRRR